MKVLNSLIVLIVGQRAKGERVIIPTPPQPRKSNPNEIENWAKEFNFGRLSERKTIYLGQNYFN